MRLLSYLFTVLYDYSNYILIGILGKFSEAFLVLTLLVKLHSPAFKIVSINEFNNLLNGQDINAHT